MPDLTQLTREHATDSPYAVTPRNIEIACGYALRMAERWKGRLQAWMDPVELEEAVIAAVMRSAENYQPDHAQNATFFTYACSMVRGALMESDRKLRKRAPDISLDNYYNDLFGAAHDPDYTLNGLQRFIDQWSDRSDPTEQSDTEMFARDVMLRIAPEVLSEREIDIITARYLNTEKQKDVAERWGLTPGRIHQIEDEALAKLRAALIAEGVDHR